MNKPRFSLLKGAVIGSILLIMVWVMAVPTPVTAATSGLPFTEDFSDTALDGRRDIIPGGSDNLCFAARRKDK